MRTVFNSEPVVRYTRYTNDGNFGPTFVVRRLVGRYIADGSFVEFVTDDGRKFSVTALWETPEEVQKSLARDGEANLRRYEQWVAGAREFAKVVRKSLEVKDLEPLPRSEKTRGDW